MLWHSMGLQLMKEFQGSAHLWNGEYCREWTGPLLGEKQNWAGARRVTLSPSGGAADTVWLEKAHLRTRPPSEPTRKESRSQGETARAVTPILLPPLAYRGPELQFMTRWDTLQTLACTFYSPVPPFFMLETAATLPPPEHIFRLQTI